MAFSTGNPIGSTDPRDLSDNSDDIDVWANSETLEAHPNRLGVPRKTMYGMETEFDAKLVDFTNQINDIVIAGGQIFADEATGRAAVQDEQYYLTEGDSPDIATILWERLSSSTSRRVAENPDAALLYAIIDLQKTLLSEGDKAPLSSYFDVGGTSVIAANGAVVGGTPVALQTSKNAYSRSPYSNYDDEGGAVLIDENGVVVGGPSVIKKIESALNAESISTAFSGTQTPYIVDGRLEAIGASGDSLVADISPASFIGSATAGRGFISAAADIASIGTKTPLVISDLGWPSGPAMIPSGENVLMVIPAFGQSNSVGAQGYTPLVRLTDNLLPDTLLMPDGPGFIDVRLGLGASGGSVGSEAVFDPESITGFQPLISRRSVITSDRGATPLEGLGFAFSEAVNASCGFRPRICMFSHGYGGRFYNDLMRGSIPYENGMDALQRIKDLAESQGWQVFVPFVVLIHGESDSSKPQYIDGLIDWQAEYEEDVKSITEQMADVPFICSQASTFTNDNTYGVMASYLAAKGSSKFHLTSPYYPYPLASDNLHLGLSAPVLGEKIAHTAARALGLFGTKPIGWISPKSVTLASANAIDIVFDVPSLPLVRDTADAVVNSPAPDNWGFRVVDGGTEIPIISVAFLNQSTVRIGTSTTPGVGATVQYATTGFSGTKVTGEQPRGQLRDSQSTPSILTGQPLYNWCPHFIEEISQ